MRKYGAILVAIWVDDPDWRTLSQNAQHTYLMLVTQPDLSSAGVLPLTTRRWSKYAGDTTPESIAKAIGELSERHYVIIDEDTEELLVRSFVRHDGGIQVPNRRKAVLAAAESTASPILRAAIGLELDRLGVDHDLGESPQVTSNAKAIPMASGTASESTQVKDQNQNQNQNQHQNQPAAAPLEPDRFAAFWTAYPRKVGKRKAQTAYTGARKRATQEQIIAGARRYAADPNRADEFTAHPTTWLNRDGWDDEPLPARTAGRPPPSRVHRQPGQRAWQE